MELETANQENKKKHKLALADAITQDILFDKPRVYFLGFSIGVLATSTITYIIGSGNLNIAYSALALITIIRILKKWPREI